MARKENCQCERPDYWVDTKGRKSNVCKRCSGFLPDVDKEIKERQQKEKDRREKGVVVPPHSSQDYPSWVCRGGCGHITPADSPHVKCPNCNSPLVRWLKYEEKRV
jgi:rubrerythrin